MDEYKDEWVNESPCKGNINKFANCPNIWKYFTEACKGLEGVLTPGLYPVSEKV